MTAAHNVETTPAMLRGLVAADWLGIRRFPLWCAA